MKGEKKYYGVNAAKALFEKRKEDIVRIYLTEDRVKPLGHMLKWCAANKKAYHILPLKDLEKIAEASHHEGVCIVAKGKKDFPITDLSEKNMRENECIIFLDGVGNPHNVGAIVRTCAHFDIRYIMVGRESEIQFSGATARVAEGGCEAVNIVRVGTELVLRDFAKKFKFQIVGTTSRKAKSIFSGALPSRMILVLGNEGTGMKAELEKICTALVSIPGTGSVESLNVATAAGVLAAEHWRQYKARTK